MNRGSGYTQDYIRMKNHTYAIITVVFILFVSPVFSREPALPEGLGGDADKTNSTEKKKAEPALPSGLGEEEETREKSETPGLPSGLGEESGPALPEGLDSGQKETETKVGKTEPSFKRFMEILPFQMTGFWDNRIGVRTQEDPNQRQLSIGESRLQLELEKAKPGVILKGTFDFVFDPVLEEYRPDLETGRGWVDVRELSMTITPLSFLDLKLGRQILTWGTGDFIFINDLFPKDWQSFFVGRDQEYLKAPSDAVKSSVFTPVVNIDFVVSPRFDSDRHIDGSRISYWSDFMGRRAGRHDPFRREKPDKWFEDYEYSWRIYRNLGGKELALYGYRGFWKSPGGFDPVTREALFPRLSVYGASIRAMVQIGRAHV